MSTTILFSLLDNYRLDLKSLHPSDRMAAACRLMGWPHLVADDTYRQMFSEWRKGVAL